MIKSYADLKQSKKLAQFLPLESADMYFWKRTWRENDYTISVGHSKELQEGFESKCIEYIPCWSFASLLQVLPLKIYDEFDSNDYELEIDMINKMPRYIRLGDIYHSQFPYDFEKDTLLDNIVESIIWLNDNNYLEL